MVVTVIATFNESKGEYFKDYDSLSIVKWSGVTFTFPIFVFSFLTQINLLQCFEELEKPSLRRMHKVLAKQHFICFTIFLITGVFGYLSFPKEDKITSFYLQRYDPVAHTDILIVKLT